MKKFRICLILSIFMLMAASSAFSQNQEKRYINWLESRSMLHGSVKMAEKLSGSNAQWKHPYGKPQPEKLISLSSVWFTAYPASTITPKDRSIVETLGDEELWKVFKEMGIEGMHTSPLKRAGGIMGMDYTPTIDGGFDRIGIDIDPVFGTDGQYVQMTKTAGKYNGIIAGDTVPGHTGKGPDFLLALMNYKDYPGLYHLIEIDEKDWDILPAMTEGGLTKNLSMETVEKLYKKGYIVGKLERVIFYEPGVKDTNWSATRAVEGVDGKKRRWVYLHYFKEGQPTLNWLDPSYAAARLISGDVIKSLDVLGAKVIRLDANGFLGAESRAGSFEAFSEGHPLSVNITDNIAMFIRKMGGFSFQELNLSFENLRDFSRNGPDLSYDFITRPAYLHALLTGDGELLRLTLRKMHEYEINPKSLIHALQNHDEITYELIHFVKHRDDEFEYHGKTVKGGELREKIIAEAKAKATGEKAPYNRITGNGICATLAGYCAASLGIKDPYNMKPEELEMVKKAHLLLAFYNAMQPGVFALSGWDLTGALPLDPDSVKELLADGDYRWVNRGSYDLMNFNPDAEKSSAGIPRAVCLYGPVNEQIKDPDSFVSRLKKILDARKKYGIALSEQFPIPHVKNTSVVLMIHRLPDEKGLQITALNFDRKPVEEMIKIEEAGGCQVIDIVSEKPDGEVSLDGTFGIRLDALEGKALVIKKQ